MPGGAGAHVERRTAQALSKRDIIRSLKRHDAREVYQIITNRQQNPAGGFTGVLGGRQ